MKRFVSICLTGLAILSMTGCSATVSKLSDDQLNQVADYAAEVALSYDKKYTDKYEETQESSTEATSEENTAETDASDDQTSHEDESKPAAVMNVQDILGMDGFEISVDGYNISDTYPENNTEQALFVMKATEKTRLLTITLNVKNVSGKVQNVNIMKYQARYRAIVNQAGRLNAQITLLMDAFNTFEGSFKDGETKKLVLVFVTDKQKKSDIDSLSLFIACGDKSGNLTLK